jgi:hypothetical protein
MPTPTVMQRNDDNHQNATSIVTITIKRKSKYAPSSLCQKPHEKESPSTLRHYAKGKHPKRYLTISSQECKQMGERHRRWEQG